MSVEKGICRLALIPMRKEPDDQSEMVNQILFGEHYEIQNRSIDGKWMEIALQFDGYTGWIDSKQNHFISEEYFEQIGRSDYRVCIDILSHIYFRQVHLHIPIGSIIPISTNELFKLEESISFSGNTKSLGQKKDMNFLEKTALKYLHAPYLWGGKSPFGIDCSGFTQQVFKICGYSLPRDAWQQEKKGLMVEGLPGILPGDLVFFKNDTGRINHVGIYLDGGRIIHASGKVRIDKLDEKGIFDSARGVYTHAMNSIKRILKYTHGQ
jgi:hypothetical protein